MTGRAIPKTTKKKGPSVKTARDKADTAFSLYIRVRDGACVICGSTEALQCSHFYGKKARPAVRYHERNAHAMCARCHLRHHKHDPEIYADWMRKNYTPYELDELLEQSRTIQKRGAGWFLAAKEEADLALAKLNLDR
jgi:5-methylcytosine-specific restriction endonuclease McrA